MTSYGVLLSSASRDVWPDLVGPTYDTLPAAIKWADRVAEAQPGLFVTLVERANPGDPWTLLRSQVTAAEWIAMQGDPATPANT